MLHLLPWKGSFLGSSNIRELYFPFRIDTNFIIKISDFGLSVSIEYSKVYFRQNETDVIKLPIKWLAPESITDGIFSEKSDVVRSTYDVLLWLCFVHTYNYV